MRTPWGYDVSETLEPIITADEFDVITNYTYTSNPRISAAVNAASQAIRNYCGWHISPALTCTANPAGGAIVTKLPAAYVSAVSSIVEDDTTLAETDDYEWRKDGLLKRAYPYRWSDTWDGIEVTYTAGYDTEAVPDLVEAVCTVAVGVLAVSPGVTSESADGVAISYSASASSIAASLTSSQKAALEPYKAVSSHAA